MFKKDLNNNTTPKSQRLLLSHNFVVAGRVFFEIFLNIFIWKYTKDLTVIAWFNIIYLALHTISFSFAASFIKKGKVNIMRMISLIGLAVLYLSIFLLSKNAIHYLYYIAFVMGLFNGIYWVSYQVVRFDLTHQLNRGNYVGLEKGTKMFVDIVIPMLGGAIITFNLFGLGYANIFLLGGLFFLCAAWLGNIKLPHKESKSLKLKATFSKMWRHVDIRKTLFAHTLGTLGRGGIIIRLLLPLILFSAVSNEFELGGLLSIFAAVGIVGSILFGKLVNYAYYQKSVVVGGIGFVALVLLTMVFPNYWLYIVFGAVAKIVSILIDIPKRVMKENLVQSLGDADDYRIEYIVIREWFSIGIGRLAGYIFLFWMIGIQVEQLQWFLVFVIIAVFAEIFLLKSIVPRK